MQAETEKYVHHLVLYGVDVDDCGPSVCYNGTATLEEYISLCASITYHTLYGWGPGASGLVTPDNVGFRVGEEGIKSLFIQTHYNNPDGDEGAIDDSGLRVYYTEELRDMDAGVMLLGDPQIILVGTQLPVGKSRYDFSCPSYCSEQLFEACIDENVFVAFRLRGILYGQ